MSIHCLLYFGVSKKFLMRSIPKYCYYCYFNLNLIPNIDKYLASLVQTVIHVKQSFCQTNLLSSMHLNSVVNREPRSHEIMKFECLQKDAKQCCNITILNCISVAQLRHFPGGGNLAFFGKLNIVLRFFIRLSPMFNVEFGLWGGDGPMTP